MARSPRLLSLTGVVAALAVPALALSSPASADPGDEHRSSTGAQHAASPSPSPQGQERRAQPGATPAGKPSARPTPADPKNRRGGGEGVGTGRGNGAAGGQDAPEADPAGNNGTIKIDYPTGDSGNAQRPRPGCGFRLRMFNFDDDQSGTLTVTAQAPTDGGTLLTRRLLLSDGPAGGGQDVDQVYSFTTSDLGLTGTPDSQHGWHVKVAVDADDAPGGAKQKVFWLDCPTAEGVAGVPPAARTAVRTTTREQARLITTELVAEEAPVAQSRTPFTGGGGFLRGAALPFTGIPLAVLLASALTSVVLGLTALGAGRRRP